MDTHSNMIIAKGKIVTASVSRCIVDEYSHKCIVTFTDGKQYRYHRQNLIWLKNPASLDPSEYRLHSKGTTLRNVSAIYRFGGSSTGLAYWHVCFSNGQERSFKNNEIELCRLCLSDVPSRRVFEYFKSIARIISVHAEDDTPILEKQYEKIDFLDDRTIASAYLNPGKYEDSMSFVPTPIFPFGCNKSQFRAVSLKVLRGPGKPRQSST